LEIEIEERHSGLRIADYLIADCGLRIADYLIADCGLRI
jgi:hypothetical protein